MKKNIIICIAVIMTALNVRADNLVVSDQNMIKNQLKTCIISINYSNSKYYVSFQMDLTLPEGIIINKDECALGNCINDEEQELVIGKIGENKYRLTSTSFNLITFDFYRREVIHLSLMATDNTSGGVATLSNILFVQNFSSNSVSRVYLDDVSFNISIVDKIEFADASVKSICVNKWDKNGDGELDTGEAASVYDLSNTFKGKNYITSFKELQHFGLTSIRAESFNGCTGLKSIVLPSGLVEIYEYAFKNCTGLSSLTIPDNVTTIGKMCLLGCSSLTSLTIPNSVTSIGDYAFEGCSALTTLNLPNSIKTIGTRLFYGCKSLTSITIPSGVTSIGMLAFFGCSNLTSINIPNNVTSIGSLALNCGNLASVIVNRSVPIPLSQDICANYNNIILYVPKGSKAAYEAADYWKKFSKIVEHSDGIIIADANGDGVVSIADVTAIINKINNNVTGTFIESAADVNGDGLITIADVTGVINIINQ